MGRVHRRALRRAADILGGSHALCDYLQVPAGELRRWLEGADAPPAGIFFRVVDLILEDQLRPAAPAPSAPTEEDDRPERA